MSIKVMQQVWERSSHDGTHLLAMLALADWCNDDGVCWPSQSKIAPRLRIGERATRKILRMLETSGELYMRQGRGKVKSRYLITIGLDLARLIEVLIEYFSMEKGKAAEIAKAILFKRDPQPEGNGGSAQVNQAEQMAPSEGNERSGQRGTNVPRDSDDLGAMTDAPRSDPSLDPSIDPSSKNLFAANAAETSKLSEESRLEEKSVPLHVAIIDAWFKAIPEDVRPVGEPAYSRNVKVAAALRDAGISAEQIGAFVSKTYPKYRDWARAKKMPSVMTLEHVKTYIKDWLAAECKGASSTPSDYLAEPKREWSF